MQSAKSVACSFSRYISSSTLFIFALSKESTYGVLDVDEGAFLGGTRPNSFLETNMDYYVSIATELRNSVEKLIAYRVTDGSNKSLRPQKSISTGGTAGWACVSGAASWLIFLLAFGGLSSVKILSTTSGICSWDNSSLMFSTGFPQ